VFPLGADELGRASWSKRIRRIRKSSGSVAPKKARLSRSEKDAPRAPRAAWVALRWRGSESMRTPSMSKMTAANGLLGMERGGAAVVKRRASGTFASEDLGVIEPGASSGAARNAATLVRAVQNVRSASGKLAEADLLYSTERGAERYFWG
jgi:hypothetical protein